MKSRYYYAFFDIDKTILPGYSIIDFAHFLSAHDRFKPSCWESISSGIEHYKKGQFTYNQFADIVISTYADGVCNQSVTDIDNLSQIFWSKRINTIYPFVDPLFKKLHAENANLVAISGSSIESLKPLLEKLKFDTSITTEIEIKDGQYLNRVKQNVGSHENKQKIIQEYFKGINRNGSYLYGFGDSVADLSFLSIVDLPVVIGDHDQELNKVAQRNGWKVVKNPEDISFIKTIL